METYSAPGKMERERQGSEFFSEEEDFLPSDTLHQSFVGSLEPASVSPGFLMISARKCRRNVRTDGGRKRRQLEFVKCEDCRKDKQKCLPVERAWPQKCDRCIDRGLSCSEGKRAARKSRRSDKPSNPICPETDITRAPTGIEIDDWAFLVNYRTIMGQAMDCLQKLKTNIERLFSTPLDFLECSDELDYMKFERFFNKLGPLILTHATNVLSLYGNTDKRHVLSALIGQLTTNICGSQTYDSTILEPDDLLESATTDVSQLGGVECHFLACTQRIKKYDSWKDDSSHALHDRRQSDLRLVKELSAIIHMKGEHVLTKSGLWKSLPEIVRRYASYLPEEVESLDSGGDFPSITMEKHDCLGRSTFLRHLDHSNSQRLHNYFDSLLRVAEALHTIEDQEILRDLVSSLDRQDILGRSVLHEACQKGYVGIVQKLLELGISPWGRTITGALPLHYAAATGASDICQMLPLLKYDQVNWKDKFQMSPLFYAALKGHSNTVNVLLQSGAFDPNEQGPIGTSLLRVAVRDCNEKMVEWLLKAGACPTLECNKDIFYESVRSSNSGIMKTLGEYPVAVDERFSFGRTPLCIAAENGFIDGVTYLTGRSDVDVNWQDSSGRTPLMRAARMGHQKVVEILINLSQTDLLLRDNLNKTAMDQAGNMEIFSLINEESMRRTKRVLVQVAVGLDAMFDVSCPGWVGK